MNQSYLNHPEAEDVVERYKGRQLEFQQKISDTDQFPDELLFQICQGRYNQASEPEQKVILSAFWELIARYQKIIYNICYRFLPNRHPVADKGKQDQGENIGLDLDDFYIYVEEQMLSKLKNGAFFLKFQDLGDFQKNFKNTLKRYISDYYLREYWRKNKKQNNAKTISLDYQQEIGNEPQSPQSMDESPEECTPQQEYNNLVHRLEQALKNLDITKAKLFEFLYQVPTLCVREFISDARIHSATCNGTVEPGRAFTRTQEILEGACRENEERLVKWMWKDDRRPKENLLDMLTKTFIQKIQFLEEMGLLQRKDKEDGSPVIKEIQKKYARKDRQHVEPLSDVAIMEEIQKKYARKEQQSMELRKKINNFLQLSYATIALVLNSTEEYCYKLRRQLKQEWKLALKEKFVEGISNE